MLHVCLASLKLGYYIHFISLEATKGQTATDMLVKHKIQYNTEKNKHKDKNKIILQ